MKKHIAVALILGLAACGDKGQLDAVAADAAPKPITAPAEPAKADADKDLELRVMQAILAGKLHNIGVEASGGVVTLLGSAPSRRDIDRAVKIAAKVEGVRVVESKLEVVTGS